MSLAELEAYYTAPRQSYKTMLRNLKRSLKRSRLKTSKRIKSSIRKARAKTIISYKKQYFVSNAYKDVTLAVRQNEDIAIMSIASIVVLAGAAAVTLSEIMFSLSLSLFEVSDKTGISILSLMLLASVSTFLFYGWFSALLMNLLSVSVMDGATRKKIRSVRLTFKRSLRSAARIFNSWLLILIFIFAPLMILTILTLIYAQASDITMYQLINLAQYVVIAAIAWAIYVLLQYSLVPAVSLFESNVPLTRTFGRSRQLVGRKGRMFILFAYILLSLYVMLSFFVSLALEQLLSIEKWLVFGSFALLGICVFNAVITILYRKRRLARVN